MSAFTQSDWTEMSSAVSSLLDEAASQPAFGVQAVFAYALELRIVEKWSALSDAAGLDVAGIAVMTTRRRKRC